MQNAIPYFPQEHGTNNQEDREDKIDSMMWYND